jgi:amino acid transporter
MISASGPGMAILMLLLLPFFWSIPMGLVCSELGTAIPDEGGFYRWVQRAMVNFGAFRLDGGAVFPSMWIPVSTWFWL